MKINKDYEINLDEILSSPTELTPATYQYYKNLKNRTIIINDQIDSEIVEHAILPLIEMDNDGTDEPITIRLSTVGGSLFDGITLCDIIDGLKTKTTIIVQTYAYSMGGLSLWQDIITLMLKKFVISIAQHFYMLVALIWKAIRHQ